MPKLDNSNIAVEEKLQELLKGEEFSYNEEELKNKSNSVYNKYIKRVIDVILAVVLAVILSPVYIIISLLIVIESGFPILYRAQRGGYKGKTFKINKFRSMVKDADKIGGGTTALNDSRITKVGAFLRKTKLDEITQLFNIISGEMSFIGPRPELTMYTDNYEDLEKYILTVRPGITDFSSITFISLDEIVGGTNADEIYEKYVLKKKNELRLKYVKEISFKTDLKLFCLTVYKVIEKAVNVIVRIFKK